MDASILHYRITAIRIQERCKNCGSTTRLDTCGKPSPADGWSCVMRRVSAYYDNRDCNNYPVSYAACRPDDPIGYGQTFTTNVREVTCPACLATPTVLALLIIEGNARVEHGLAQLSSAVIELTKAIEGTRSR